MNATKHRKSQVEVEIIDPEEQLTVEEEALLLRQCRLCKVEMVEEAIDRGKVTSDFIFSNGEPMLVAACKPGHKKLAKLLIRKGASLDAVDGEGNTAAHWSFANGFSHLAEYLIAKGASDRIVNLEGFTCRTWRQPEVVQDTDDCTHGSGWNGAQGQPSHQSADRLSFPPVNAPLARRQGSMKYQQKVKARKLGLRKATGRPLSHQVRSKSVPVDQERAMDKACSDVEGGHSAELSLRASYTPVTPPPLPLPTKKENKVFESPGRSHGGSPGRNSEREALDRSPLQSPSRQRRGAQMDGRRKSLENVEYDTGLKNLLNFDRRGQEDGAEPLINSPTSKEAMNRLGILPKELLVPNREALMKKYKDEKIVEMRMAFGEDRATELLEKCIQERKRLQARSKDATLNVLFAEFAKDMTLSLADFLNMMTHLELLIKDGAEEGKVNKTQACAIFGAYATRGSSKNQEVTWEQFVKLEKKLAKSLGFASISSAGGHKDKIQSPAQTARSGSDKDKRKPLGSENTFSMMNAPDKIQELRSKFEKDHKTEVRRIERNFEKILEVRAQHSDFEEALKQKEITRLARLESRTMEMAESRIEQQMKHVERVLKHETFLHKKQVEEVERMQQKAEEARLIIEQRVRERDERIRLNTEMMKIKQEQRQEQNRQHRRKEEYLKKKLLDKIAKDQMRAQKNREEVEAVKKEKKKIWSKHEQDKLLFTSAQTTFEKTGELKKPLGVKDLGYFEELVERKMVHDHEDRNPEAVLLEKDTAYQGKVRKGEYAFFKVFVPEAHQIKFQMKSAHGGTEIFVGNFQCPQPQKEFNTWSKVGHDKIVIFHLDKKFNLGYSYASIFGNSDSKFSVTVTWSSESHGAVGKYSQMKMLQEEVGTEEQVMSRVRSRIDALIQKRLEGQDANFVSKYTELFLDQRIGTQPTSDAP